MTGERLDKETEIEVKRIAQKFIDILNYNDVNANVGVLSICLAMKTAIRSLRNSKKDQKELFESVFKMLRETYD